MVKGRVGQRFIEDEANLVFRSNGREYVECGIRGSKGEPIIGRVADKGIPKRLLLRANVGTKPVDADVGLGPLSQTKAAACISECSSSSKASEQGLERVGGNQYAASLLQDGLDLNGVEILIRSMHEGIAYERLEQIEMVVTFV